MRKFLVRMTRILVVCLIGLVGFYTIAQANMIYFPSAYSPADVAAMERDGLRRVEFTTKQGKQAAFYKGPAAGVPAKIWLVFCGNGARSADYREVAVRDDFGYLFIDYPGYGACEGKPGPRRIDDQVAGAVAALTGMLGVGQAELKEKLCAFGHSLGAAVALRSAVMFEIDEVVIVSPFTSMKAMAELVVGKILSSILLHRFDNVKALSDLTAAVPGARVTLFHGKADDVVPFSMGETLATRFVKNVAFAPVEGAGHNDIIGLQLAPITAAMAR